MLEIKLSEAGKRFQYEWIFNKVDLRIPPFTKIAVTGSNGSGKSTLLKCLSGQIPLTEGKIEYSLNGEPLASDDYFRYLRSEEHTSELQSRENLVCRL